MDRRELIAGSLLAGASLAAAAQAAPTPAGPLPRRTETRVAFMITEGANVIDMAGPWEVFQDSMLHGPDGDRGFSLYTVGASTEPVRMTGGLRVVPTYRFDEAPQPHVIMVGAQKGGPASRDWLQRASPAADITVSVCTGAFQLARAGLLDGLPATTHHDFFDKFAQEFPKIELRRGLRFVDNGKIASAGGLTSGIDLALHIVGRYLGLEAAQATADYMEHASQAWRQA